MDLHFTTFFLSLFPYFYELKSILYKQKIEGIIKRALPNINHLISK